jgi:hypothetical protein
MNVITEISEVMEQIKADRKAFLTGRHKPEIEKALAKMRGQSLQGAGHAINAARVAGRLYGTAYVPFLPAPKNATNKKLASKKLNKAA